jgi:hypothetical protein
MSNASLDIEVSSSRESINRFKRRTWYIVKNKDKYADSKAKKRAMSIALQKKSRSEKVYVEELTEPEKEKAEHGMKIEKVEIGELGELEDLIEKYEAWYDQLEFEYSEIYCDF